MTPHKVRANTTSTATMIPTIFSIWTSKWSHIDINGFIQLDIISNNTKQFNPDFDSDLYTWHRYGCIQGVSAWPHPSRCLCHHPHSVGGSWVQIFHNHTVFLTFYSNVECFTWKLKVIHQNLYVYHKKILTFNYAWLPVGRRLK